MVVSLMRTLSAAALAVALLVFAGCEGEEGSSGSGIKLTSSTVSSATVNGHAHTASILFSDLQGGKTVTYQSSSVSGHTHTITLTADQLTALYQGYRVQITSSQANGHTHDWLITGGNLVYEYLCYTCHADSKRGTSGMSSLPSLASQRVAIMYPSAQPLYNPGTLAVATTSLTTATEGIAYTQSLTATGGTSPYSWSASALPSGLSQAGGVISGIPTTNGVYSVTLTVSDAGTPAGRAAKALSLIVAPSAPLASSGRAVYDTNCSGCHQLGSYDTVGNGVAPDLSGRSSLIAGKITGGHNGISLSVQQLADLTAFVGTY